MLRCRGEAPAVAGGGAGAAAAGERGELKGIFGGGARFKPRLLWLAASVLRWML